MDLSSSPIATLEAKNVTSGGEVFGVYRGRTFFLVAILIEPRLVFVRDV